MKTIMHLKVQYFCPGMTYAMTKFVEKCPVCLRSKGWPGFPYKGPLNPLGADDMPNKQVHIDLLGSFKTLSGGKKFVLVMTDAFS
jgi:hypothetical protein